MALPTHILLAYGYILLFGWVLVEQFGIPLPATPVLLAAGGLSAAHQISFGAAFLVGFLACMTADTSWFLIGRRYGHHVLRILCKLSMEPTICVRRTQDSFGRRRGVMLMFAKFVPGLATLAAPVAGENGMSLPRFLFFDGIGATLWLLALLTRRQAFWRRSEAQSEPVELGGALLGRSSGAGDTGVLYCAGLSAAHGAEKAGCLATGAGRTEGAA